MTAAYLYGAVRTTFGRFNGALDGVRPDDLASYVIKALLKRHPQLDGGAIDEAITVGVDETRQPFPGRRQHSGVHSPWLAADQQSRCHPSGPSGGVMDLAIGAKAVLALMTLSTKDGSPKLISDMQLSADGCGVREPCVHRLRCLPAY
jgi:hypothetical protein